MPNILIEPITPDAFSPYGHIIAFSEHPQDERFEVVLQEASEPWRIAVFRVKIRIAKRLERHVHSMESFEPMQGMGILLVALPETPQQIHAFALDRPVCLHKGIWHEVLTLSDEATYKITENSNVTSEFFELSPEIQACVCYK